MRFRVGMCGTATDRLGVASERLLSVADGRMLIARMLIAPGALFAVAAGVSAATVPNMNGDYV